MGPTTWINLLSNQLKLSTSWDNFSGTGGISNMHVPDEALRDDSSRDFFFKYSICPLVRGAVWSLQQYTFWLLKSQIRSWKYLNGLLLEFLGSLSIFSSWFLLQVHCLNDEHWQFSYCAAINRQILQVYQNVCFNQIVSFGQKIVLYFHMTKNEMCLTLIIKWLEIDLTSKVIYRRSPQKTNIAVNSFHF